MVVVAIVDVVEGFVAWFRCRHFEKHPHPRLAFGRNATELVAAAVVSKIFVVVWLGPTHWYVRSGANFGILDENRGMVVAIVFVFAFEQVSSTMTISGCLSSDDGGTIR